ncbi:MAG: hypothetical protein IK025_05595 [Bacteroidales bacterium]|nr:hypothetical protein [Bacteroidales bacterium]
MKRGLLLAVIVLYSALVFAQKENASKHLVYKEISPNGYVSHYFHVLAGKKLALTYSEFTILLYGPFLDCDMVSRNPAGYKMLHVVDGKEDIYIADVASPKFNKINKKSIIEDHKQNSDFMKAAMVNSADTAIFDESVLMEFTPNIGKAKIDNYDCTIGVMQISKSYCWKIWYTKEINYNWVFNDYFWLVPGTIIRAEDSDGCVYALEREEDTDFVLQETAESVREALRIFLNR